MATPDLPTLPGTHTWMAGGPLLGRAGQAPVYSSDDTVVWVWDADTGDRVTDLLNESGNPVTAPEVRDGWVVGVGVPVAVKVASFSAGQFGKRQLMVPVQSFKDAAAAVAPTDNQVATLMGNSGSASRTVTDGLYVAQSDLYTGGGLVKSSKLPDLSGTYAPRAGSWAGDSGRRYKPFLGVVRNDGSGWALIDDSGHRPTGFGAITVLSDRLQIAYDASVLKVGSLQGVLDETLAAMGYQVGTSVGKDYVELYFYRQSPHYIADYVQYTGSAWESFNGVFSPSYNGAGVLTLTHEPMGTTGQQAVMATPRGTAAALAGAYGDTTSQVTFYTGSWGSLSATGAASASQHRVYVVRYGQRAAVPKVDPATIVAEFGNVWLMGAGEIAA